MKVLIFSSRPQTACFHVVNRNRTAVVNWKLRKYADESSCHAIHTVNFPIIFPQLSCSVRSILYQVGLCGLFQQGQALLGYAVLQSARLGGAHGWVAVSAILPFPCLVLVLTFTLWFLAWPLPAIANGCLHE